MIHLVQLVETLLDEEHQVEHEVLVDSKICLEEAEGLNNNHQVSISKIYSVEEVSEECEDNNQKEKLMFKKNL
jgi:hypothetical protein